MSGIYWRLAPFLPSLFFLLITFGFWGEYPSLDPMLNYRDAAQLHQSGFRDLGLTQNGNIIHPPLLNLLISAGFSLFGKSPFAYNAIGFLLFVTSSLVFYKFTRQFGRFFALFSPLLLFSNPMVISNFFYASYEMATFTGLIFLLYFFRSNSNIPLALTLAFFPLMKETALVIPLVLLAWLVFLKLRHKQKMLPSLLVFVPFFLVWVSWTLYAKESGLTPWRDISGFFPPAKSSFQLVIDNIFSLKLFNSYLLNNLFNLFIFNFQWVYPGLILLCLLILRRLPKFPAILIFLSLVSFAYALLVLSYPTWTIPRYSLPLYPFLFFLLAFLIFQLSPRWRYLFLPVALLTTLISNFAASDPLTKKIFPGEMAYYGVKFYNLPFLPFSLDSANYNRDFLLAVKNQNLVIKEIITKDANLVVTDCHRLKLGEKLWTIYLTRDFAQFPVQRLIECINTWDAASQSQRLLSAKILWL